jgi:hypothetical protein
MELRTVVLSDAKAIRTDEHRPSRVLPSMTLRSFILPITVLCALGIQSLPAQGSSSWEFLPDSLHFIPLRASYHEARTGIVYVPGRVQTNFTLGNSLHLLQFRVGEDQTISIGSDIMAYAQFNFLRTLEIMVDNVDALWGMSGVYRRTMDQSSLVLRLRVMHNSAHMVDEHYSPDNYRRLIKPVPTNLTMEFTELTAAYERENDRFAARVYASGAYRLKVSPVAVFKKPFGSFGAEFAEKTLVGDFLGKRTTLFFAAHGEVEGTPTYHLGLNTLLGIKLGGWQQRGILVFLSYYSGNNFFSEYYDERISDFGFGWQIEIL